MKKEKHIEIFWGKKKQNEYNLCKTFVFMAADFGIFSCIGSFYDYEGGKEKSPVFC